MMRKIARNLLLALAVLTSSGCGGGGLCPIGIPECCRNVVFGCSPFELPFGCSCADYGYATTAASLTKLSAAAAAGLDDVWSGSLRQQRSSCPGLPESISGNLQVKTSGKRMRISVPGYGTLRGQLRGAQYTVSGSVRLITGGRGSAAVRLTPRDGSKAETSVTVTYRTAGKRVCSATYAGDIKSNAN